MILRRTAMVFLLSMALALTGACGGSAATNDPEIRLYYYGSNAASSGGTSVGSTKQDAETVHGIYSAISSDGINFTEESGVRFEKAGIADPDVFPVTYDNYVMFTSIGRRLVKATSMIDAGTFVEDTEFDWDSGSVCSSYLVASHHTTFYCDGGDIRYAFYNASTGGLEPAGVALENPFDSGTICDPTVVRIDSGDYVMYYGYAPEGSTGPLQHSIYYALSANGLTYIDAGIMIKDQASAPGAIFLNGKIYLYYVDGAADTTAVGISEDNGYSFTFQSIAITGRTADSVQDPNPAYNYPPYTYE